MKKEEGQQSQRPRRKIKDYLRRQTSSEEEEKESMY